MPVNVKKEVQLAVDQYLQLFVEFKELKDQMDSLRDVIEPYMKEHEIEAIHSTDGNGRVELSQQERPVMNTRYTTYDVEQVRNILPANVRKKCIVEVVDKEKLEALHKLGEVSPDVLACKVTKTTHMFTAKVSK